MTSHHTPSRFHRDEPLNAAILHREERGHQLDAVAAGLVWAASYGRGHVDPAHRRSS
jgi:hypothetical protein